MSFAFGFTGDDISDDENTPQFTQNEPQVTQNEHPPLEPKLHSLLEILSTLKDVRLTFDNYTTPGGNIIYRRELFDIKHQAMMEEDAEKSSEVHKILVGSNNSDEVDLRKNVYEGGFKLWECSYDLVDELETQIKNGQLSQFSSFLELGCGTSLPTCYLLMKTFLTEQNSKISLVLSDFNYEVLRLVTVPNLIVHWASTLLPERLSELVGDVTLGNDELLLTQDLVEEFQNQLLKRNIVLQFISGLWGAQFCAIALQFQPQVILTSETIYSLDTIPFVIEVLLQLFQSSDKYLAMVAAKSYYFGVGGSIREFVEKLDLAKPANLIVSTVGINKGELKRDIVKLSKEQIA